MAKMRDGEDFEIAVKAEGGGVLVYLKVVPGASRTGVVGMLGDRLKVTVSSPPEGGKANKMICQFLGKLFGVGKGNVEVVKGHGMALKCVFVGGVDEAGVISVLSGE